MLTKLSQEALLPSLGWRLGFPTGIIKQSLGGALGFRVDDLTQLGDLILPMGSGQVAWLPCFHQLWVWDEQGRPHAASMGVIQVLVSRSSGWI